MWSFGHCVREIEHSHHRVVIEETATTGGVWVFGGIALVTLSFLLKRPLSSGATLFDEAVAVLVTLFCALAAVFASVQSTYTADRASGQFIVERRILFSTIRTAYEAHTIDRVYVRDTLRGSGLYIRFKSGRSKRLLMSSGFDPLDALTAALNTTLYTHRER